MQLSFAVFPLVMFTGDRAKMGEFVSSAKMQIVGYTIAVTIALLNLWLLYQTFSGWFE
jgi:manganese transport protein